MLSKIKLYLYGIVAAIGLLLIGRNKFLSNKNDKLEQTIEQKDKEIAVKEVVNIQSKEIQKSLDIVRKESDDVREEDRKKAISGDRPSYSFLDKRL